MSGAGTQLLIEVKNCDVEGVFLPSSLVKLMVDLIERLI